MKRLLFLLAASQMLAQTPVAPFTNSVVQVAVSNGPRQSVVASGVVAADGKMILTDAGILAKAREITIAYSDGELADAVFAGVQQRNHIALIPVAAAHGQMVALSPLAEGIPAATEIDAIVGGAPEAFDVAQQPVRARPVGMGAALRWRITPAPPEYARGGALLDSQGLLVAVIVMEGETLVGVPAGLAFQMDVAENDSALYKEAALPPVKVEVKMPTKPATPAAAPNVANLNLPLRATRMEWARNLPARPLAPAVVAQASAPGFDIQDVLHAVDDFTKKREYVKAIDAIEETIRKHPEAHQLYFHLGLAYWNKAALKADGTRRSTMEKSPYHKAVKAFETFLDKAPNDKLAADARFRLDTLRKLQYGYGGQ